MGYARKMDAASLGRGLASSQATSAQVALTAGNNAVSNTAAPINAANQSTQANGAGFGTAINGNNSAGNLYGQIAGIQNQADANSNAWMGAAGSALGGWASGGFKTSDENMKTDIEAANPDQALHEIVSTPVSKWKYDPAKMAQKGIPIPAGDAGENTGPMAQDVNATMGEEAAPGGKEINLISMNGKTMAAVQSLDKKVNRLAKLIEQGVSA